MLSVIGKRPAPWLVGVGILLVGGCTISVQPAWKPSPPPPSTLPDGTPLPPGALASGPGGPGSAVGPGGRGPGGLSPAAGIPPGPGVSTEQVASFRQQIASYDDDRKAMASRVQQLENQLNEKNQAIVQTSYQVRESAVQLKQAREELTRWRGEMDELRTKLRTMEKENRVTLETILKTLEQYIDREKEPTRTPTALQPAQNP